MATQFGDEARSRLAPIMTADLAKYIDGIGEMFKEVEEYAREDGGPVYLGPITGQMTPAIIAGPELTWWAYHSLGTRVSKTWDTSVLLRDKPTVKVTRLLTDGDLVGLSYRNLPIVPGESYVWRGAFKGDPGKTYLLRFSLFENINAGGGSTTNTMNIVAEEGITEFEFEVGPVPANRNYAYVYILGGLSEPVGTAFWVSTDTHVARKTKAATPLSPWAKLVNPEAAVNEAMLLYLAQLAGVRVPQGLAFRDMQSFIERAEARRRGRLDYMVDLAKATLTGTKTVITVERVTSAWTLRILTRASETPNTAKTLAAILRGKPAGIVLDYQAVSGVTWDEAISQWNSATITWDQSVNVVP